MILTISKKNGFNYIKKDMRAKIIIKNSWLRYI